MDFLEKLGRVCDVIRAQEQLHIMYMFG